MARSKPKADESRWVYQLIYSGDMARRFTQDSPVLPDVWEAFAGPKDEFEDLLLTPFQDPETGGTSAGDLCKALLDRLDPTVGNTHPEALAGSQLEDRDIAYNQSNVAVKLKFNELVRVVLPMSRWWHDRVCASRDDAHEVRKARTKRGTKSGAKRHDASGEKDDILSRLSRGEGIEEVVEALFNPDKSTRSRGARASEEPGKPVIRSEVLWMVRVIGSIALVNKGKSPDELLEIPRAEEGGQERRGLLLEIVEAAAQLLKGIDPHGKCAAHVYSVSRNRRALSSIYRSGVSVKADAVARLFDVDGSTITWAIIDSGIDAEHFAFRKLYKAPTATGVRAQKAAKNAKSQGSSDSDQPAREVYYEKAFEASDGRREVNRTRIIGTYDFSMIRKLLRVTREDHDLKKLPKSLERRLGLPEQDNSKTSKSKKSSLAGPDEREKLTAAVKELKANLRKGRELDWELVKTLIEVPHRDGDYEPPQLDHGTHVAGILAADWRIGCGGTDPPHDGGIRGICPDMKLYDLRVFGEASEPESAEFNIMSALQFVRNLNANKKFMVVHGVNLSLSIRHDVENYACGRTPICDECERLVNSGLVVVAAAGNYGYQRRGPESSLDDRYQSMTITDPGNAEAVITVGATHRDMPHTYGVSYFSSRGPTGDGRPKPDLVAPGEKIESTIPSGLTASKDGTSMAAPHVSGAAALIMARNPELIGRPVRIKQILCASATDLGRDRYFQGSGMLDILRALQSV